ncbi:MAG: UDP-N-acetylglucosamine 2-epimerase [Candidatus Altiarchaeales archaeon WOR_SM1_79]|nr:MAG: UDP-N-acetylglucosamine 2-epimerase [Candidatus Altiarchaeales archaeon WOR_SM1_79]
MEKKIVSIVGARPNFIKCAPLSREIRKEFDEILIHTGQHYDYEMNKVFFDELRIPEPDYHLDVGSGSHGAQTGEMLKRIEHVLMKEKPEWVLVYGDTNSTLSGALAASKLHIKVGHIESGLRSFDRSMPEEINRVLTDHCSDLLFCPTEIAVENLGDEGICDGVYLTGDVMVDTLNYNRKIVEKSDILEKLSLKSREYLVATIHRAGNTDNKRCLKNIVDAFCEIDETIVFPVHPRAEKFLRRYRLYDKLKKHVDITKPLGYLDFLKLMNNAKKILTDSGGVQKEAYILGVPCVTLRENTEWVETVDGGWNVLVGADNDKIVRMVNEFEPKGKQRKVFGNGDARERIVGVMKEYDQNFETT